MSDSPQTSTAQQLEQYAQLKPRTLPVQKRAMKTMDLILEAAAELVDEAGVIAFSTDLVARRAGVRIRTIYRYFPNKVGLLRALQLRLNAESVDRLARFLLLADRERDWREVVGAWVDDLVVWSRTRPGARLLMGWAYAVPELLEEEDRLNEEWAKDMMRALRARGVVASSNQLYAVCRSSIDILVSVSILATAETDAHANDIIEEMRRALISYLANYLD